MPTLFPLDVTTLPAFQAKIVIGLPIPSQAGVLRQREPHGGSCPAGWHISLPGPTQTRISGAKRTLLHGRPLDFCVDDRSVLECVRTWLRFDLPHSRCHVQRIDILGKHRGNGMIVEHARKRVNKTIAPLPENSIYPGSVHGHPVNVIPRFRVDHKFRVFSPQYFDLARRFDRTVLARLRVDHVRVLLEHRNDRPCPVHGQLDGVFPYVAFGNVALPLHKPASFPRCRLQIDGGPDRIPALPTLDQAGLFLAHGKPVLPVPVPGNRGIVGDDKLYAGPFPAFRNAPSTRPSRANVPYPGSLVLHRRLIDLGRYPRGKIEGHNARRRAYRNLRGLHFQLIHIMRKSAGNHVPVCNVVEDITEGVAPAPEAPHRQIIHQDLVDVTTIRSLDIERLTASSRDFHLAERLDCAIVPGCRGDHLVVQRYPQGNNYQTLILVLNHCFDVDLVPRFQPGQGRRHDLRHVEGNLPALDLVVLGPAKPVRVARTDGLELILELEGGRPEMLGMFGQLCIVGHRHGRKGRV